MKATTHQKISSEWYTPKDYWERIYRTFNTTKVYDPCPVGGLSRGFNALTDEWLGNYIYINPPSPAYDFAVRTLEVYNANKHKNIIYAAFSESVLFQHPDIMDQNLVCFVRNRINWIDSKTDKPATNPSNYNAFILLSCRNDVKLRFKQNFSNIGKVLKVTEF